MHVTVGALLVSGTEILLVEHRAYGIVLQPGGHLEPDNVTLAGVAERLVGQRIGRAVSAPPDRLVGPR